MLFVIALEQLPLWSEVNGTWNKLAPPGTGEGYFYAAKAIDE